MFSNFSGKRKRTVIHPVPASTERRKKHSLFIIWYKGRKGRSAVPMQHHTRGNKRQLRWEHVPRLPATHTGHGRNTLETRSRHVAPKGCISARFDAERPHIQAPCRECPLDTRPPRPWKRAEREAESDGRSFIGFFTNTSYLCGTYAQRTSLWASTTFWHKR